ncbi:MAG TPA: ATP-grasp domain-containing protein [Sedimentisphaerales bacterium]|nr:ATP-grasp domain-containing protein [Sedimentisphaerales bacterium]
MRRSAEDGSQFSTLPVVQEYVHGVGAGFFAFYQHGTLKRWYIHRRLRESPPTGGSSTAAETCYYPEIYELGKRMLDHLQWHGVAMVEFKLDERTGKVHLMEVNPKFWGSLELGLAAGVNFGELLVRTIRGEEIQAILSPDAYKRLRFFWPFDGDVANIVSQGNYRALLEYFRSDARTNLRTYGLVRALARIRHLPRAIFSLRRTRMRGSFAK